MHCFLMFIEETVDFVIVLPHNFENMWNCVELCGCFHMKDYMIIKCVVL